MAMEITCPVDGCGFSVRANDQQELMEIVKSHASEKHGQTMTDDQISELMESA